MGGVEDGIDGAAETPLAQSMDAASASNYHQSGHSDPGRLRAGKAQDEVAQQAPSSNVANLQRRVAGVLPVRVAVPRAGASFHFLRPLVIDEEPIVRFRYRTR